MALSQDQIARGDLFWDDGETLDEKSPFIASFSFNQVNGATDIYNTLLFFFPQTLLEYKVVESSDKGSGYTMGTISIFGLSESPSSVLVNGSSVGFNFTQILSVEADVALNQNFDINLIYN